MNNCLLAKNAKLWFSLLVLCSIPIRTNGDEAVVVTGGVSLWKWEKTKMEPHDHWWVNFIRASRIRIEQLKQPLSPQTQITWLVYAPAFQPRHTPEPAHLSSTFRPVQ